MPVFTTVATNIHTEIWAESEPAALGGVFTCYHCRICDAPIGTDHPERYNMRAPRERMIAHVEKCISECGVLSFTNRT